MKGLRLIQEAGGTVDIELDNGTMATGETQVQEEYLVLATQRGEWKEHPLVGAGVADMAGDEDMLYWNREITESLARVGIKIKGVSLSNGALKIKH
ncbi:MAG: hypothetical protein IKG81_15125 [Bacteroidales bacterium]|nr:hypothetical protein [Bacteroidales bacterium]